LVANETHDVAGRLRAIFSTVIVSSAGQNDNPGLPEDFGKGTLPTVVELLTATT
jgi:hypothetical protein